MNGHSVAVTADAAEQRKRDLGACNIANFARSFGIHRI
jgi:hypothetical protein